MYHGEEVPAKLLEAGGEPAHVLHPAKEPFDDVAHRIETGVVCDGLFSVAFRWNNRERAFICNALSYRRAAVSLVGDDGERRLFPVEKGVHDLAVMNMTAGDFDPQGAAFGVYGRMNFTCATAA